MGKKVLLIDKSPDVIEIITFLLKESGHQYIIAKRPFELSEVEDYIPDLIFLHTGLNNEGAGICRLLKSNNNTKNIPVLLSSTLTNLPDIAQEAKADEYMLKPFDVNELQQLMNRLLV